jgi:competence/damage-inducible protein CinA-like protein
MENPHVAGDPVEGTRSPVAEIIAIGSELLTPPRLDTNSLFLTSQLNALGVEVIAKHVVGDDRARLAAAIQTAIERSEYVFLSGGLGPTEDDVTREAAAAALGRTLEFSAAQEEILIQRFAQIRRPMADNNRRQVYLVAGAEALPNPHGTAPGQLCRTTRGALFLLPGPPREFKAMVAEQVVPRLKAELPPRVIRVRSFRVTGMGESQLDALIAPVYSKYRNPSTTVLSSLGDLWVNLYAQSDTEAEAEALLNEVGDPIAELLGDRVYSICADDTLELVVGRLLRERKATVATAESCTGGLLAARLTEYAGSSDFFVASFVTYSDAQKQSLLGVPGELIAQHTAVSESVAKAMCEAARQKTGATYALSTTGYAGPGGGTEENPVGTVYIGLATPSGARVTKLIYGMDRARIRTLAVQNALDLLRRELLAVDSG